MSPMLEHPYFGAFIMFVFTAIVFQLTLRMQRIISRKIARRQNDKLKNAPYECGPVPIKQHAKISHQFYIIAVLFLLFDVEIIFMLPWALEYKNLGFLGLVEMVIFILFLAIGFFYAWKRGALQWQNTK